LSNGVVARFPLPGNERWSIAIKLREFARNSAKPSCENGHHCWYQPIEIDQANEPGILLPDIGSQFGLGCNDRI